MQMKSGGYQKPPLSRPHSLSEENIARSVGERLSVAESPRSRDRESPKGKDRPPAPLLAKPSKYPHTRTFIPVNSKIGDRTTTLRVLQFNMLADGLSALDKDHGYL